MPESAPTGSSAASLRKGIAFLVASAFGFALMGMFVRLADQYGESIPAVQKSFFRNLVALVIAVAMVFRRFDGLMVRWFDGSWRSTLSKTIKPSNHQTIKPSNLQTIKPSNHQTIKPLGLLLLRSIFGTVGIFGNFYALSHMPVADALMLNKLSPFFAVLLSWFFLRERLTFRQGLCLAGAMAGAALVVKPGFGDASLMPALCGLVGGLGAGAAYTCLRELGLMKVNGAFIVLFFSAFSTLASIPFMVFDYHPMTAAQLLILCGAGAAAALGQFTVTAAYRFAPARQIAAWDYTNILFGALFGFLAFGQIPDWWSVLGFVMIVAMALALPSAAERGDKRMDVGNCTDRVHSAAKLG